MKTSPRSLVTIFRKHSFFSVLLLALSLSPFLVYAFKANRFGSRGMPPLRRSKKGPRYKTEEQEKQKKSKRLQTIFAAVTN